MGYFATQFMGLEYHNIHTALDDKIPFLPVFIIPYIIWYVYVPAPMIYMNFKNRKAFIRQMATLFTGAYICLIIFVLFPTSIDFRPETEGDGILLVLCRMIYANDRPVNVFPSLHCYEATAMHLATFTGEFGGKHPAMRAASGIMMVLICLSTVFAKQHSVLDLAAGCTLAVIVHILMGFVFKKNGGDKDGDKAI